MRTGSICIILTIALLVGCTSRRPSAIVVNVLRDGQSSFSPLVEGRILAFQESRPKTRDGKLIVVQSILPTHDEFEHIINDPHISKMQPDVIVLDSSEQANSNPLLKRDSETNACGTAANCPAFVPSWVSGEKLEASQQVLKAVSGVAGSGLHR